MNARTFALTGLLALGLAFVAWFFFFEESAGERRELQAELTAVEPAAASADLAPASELETPRPTSGAEDADGDARVAVESTPGAERRTWAEEDTHWLTVHVGVPEGADHGTPVTLVVLEEQDEYDDVYGGEGPFEAIRAGADPLTLANVLGATEATLGGEARLGLPPADREARLYVGGDFVYLREGFPVPSGAPESTLLVTPTLGAMVSGRLVRPEGVEGSLADVEVELDWSITRFVQLGGQDAGRLDVETRTDAEGAFAFRGVPVGGAQVVSTGDSTFARSFLEEFEPRPGEHVVLEVPLVVGGTLRGRIVDEAGEPVADADVDAVGREFFGNPSAGLRETDSGDDGAFELVGLTPGKVWLNVEHDDYQELLSESYEVADGETRDLGDVVLGRGLSIAGRVTFPDGAPAVGARVSVDADLSDNVAGSPVNPRDFAGNESSAEVGEDGAFAVTGLGPGPWVVEVEFDLEAGEESDAAERALGLWTVTEEHVGAPREDLELVLAEPVNLTGVVLATNERPITEFVVRGERSGSQWYMPPSERANDSFEVEDGRFVLTGLRAGKWTFWAEGDGFAKSAEVQLEMPTEDEVTLVLERPVVLDGVVVDPLGNPVGGAVVSKELEGTEVIEAMQGRADWPSATSDEEGAFTLLGMPPGTGSIVAKRDGFAPSEPFAYELAEGAEELEIELRLRRGGTITGIVYDADGDPAAGCMVIIQMPTMEERRMTNADANGEFAESGLKPGAWQVQAFPGIDSFEPEEGETLDQVALMKALKMKAVELADETTEHVELGAPPADPVRVAGRVTLGGDGVGDTVISFVPAGGEGGMEMLKIGTTEDDGSYELVLDEPGQYLVTIQTTGTPGRQNSVEFRREIPKGETHSLDFAMPLGKITGRVRGPDGKPVGQTRVTLTMQGGQVFGTVFGGQYNETVTEADGSYEIVFLRPGEYTVAAGGAFLGGVFGDGDSTHGRVIRSVELREDEWIADFDFELTQPGAIHGTVRDATGRPVADASIFLRDEEGRLVELFSFLRTNATGAFEYEGLAPGEYTVTARTDELSSYDGESIRVRAGETTDATVIVEQGTTLLVELIDKTGANVLSTVSVLDREGREMNGMLGLTELMERYGGGLDAEVQRIGPLAAGEYQVRCTTADGRTVKKKVKLSGKPERKVKLRLR